MSNDSDAETELAALHRERNLYAAFAVKVAAEAAIVRRLGSKNVRLFLPAVMKTMRPVIADDGDVTIKIIDSDVGDVSCRTRGAANFAALASMTWSKNLRARRASYRELWRPIPRTATKTLTI